MSRLKPYIASRPLQKLIHFEIADESGAHDDLHEICRARNAPKTRNEQKHRELDINKETRNTIFAQNEWLLLQVKICVVYDNCVTKHFLTSFCNIFHFRNILRSAIYYVLRYIMYCDILRSAIYYVM